MTYAFDTLKFMQRLEQVGIGRGQAEAHAELARDMILADTATKADLAAIETTLKSEIRTEIAGVKNEIASVRTEIIGLRTGILGNKKEFESSLRELELRMTVKLGAIIAAAVAVIPALQKFL